MPRTANKKAAKKTPAKRKYVKKAARFIQPVNTEMPETILTTSSVPKEFDELEFLDAIVQGMEQLLPEQKSRLINYLYSRYWMYITLSKLTQ